MALPIGTCFGQQYAVMQVSVMRFKPSGSMDNAVQECLVALEMTIMQVIPLRFMFSATESYIRSVLTKLTIGLCLPCASSIHGDSPCGDAALSQTKKEQAEQGLPVFADHAFHPPEEREEISWTYARMGDI